MDTYNTIVMHVLEKGREDGVGALNTQQKILYLVAELDTLANMEGLLGFYSALGQEAQATVDALDKMGAKQSAALIRRANGLFPGGMVPSDLATRDTMLVAIAKSSDREIINRIEEEFLARPDGLEEKLHAFVLAHTKELGDGD